MKIDTPKFKVEYKKAVFTFKYGTDRDGVEILAASKKGYFELLEYFSSRLVAVEGLEVDGREGTKEDVLELPRDVLTVIIGQWQEATFKKLAGGDSKPKKKRSTRKSKTA